ncbi:MAG: N-acetylglucosamine-6-phosphate deacetylase [Planctomycetota bacterium]
MTDTAITAERAILGDGATAAVAVRVVDGRVAAIHRGEPPTGWPPARRVRGTLMPGLVDLQVNGMGGAGFEAEDPAMFAVIARAAARGAAAAFLPTLITAPVDTLARRARAVATWLAQPAAADAALPLGIHLEGPFLELAGAHDPQALALPTRDNVERLLEACDGHLAMVTLAPGLPGAPAAVERLVAAGVVVALGHARSTVGFAECVAAGASVVTHLFNAMSPLHHREPGIANLALDDERLTCCLIADGHHVHPNMLRLAFRALGRARTVLVTDAVSAAGMPDGEYTLSGLPVTSREGIVRDREGRLAGSALTMAMACRGFAAAVPHADDLVLAEVAARNPARLLRRGDLGAIEVGAIARFTLREPNGSLSALTIL